MLQLSETVQRLASSLTRDMISPPLSPECGFDPNRITPAVLAATEFVANKLLAMSVHVRFIVTRFTPLPIGQGSNLLIIPIAPLDPGTWAAINKHSRRAAKKFGLSSRWMTPIDVGETRTTHWEDIIKRSLVQNDVLFSHEGLTLLNIDHVYLLKQYLNALSRNVTEHIPPHIYLDACLYLLRQLMRETRGRPFTRGFIHCTYDHLHVRDDLLLHLAKKYELQHGHEAIVMLKQKSKGNERTRFFINRRGSLMRQPALSRKPVTPNTASDVTPITRGEWRLLMEQSLVHLGMTPFR
ncbi:predicted protein [Uncinocarpus reesii 1704]|uniref:DUF7582 domain-containing protein n=1 Tax=Uncinocarpus reesii (strain UAMH 1704) TaxID=336963 RepID=C4JIR9_UNCRE|nr:uncharacterized protein UREG_02930 [Uncinocarpus reesii 1704]EEP78081.1 predicted protein [Uncinocarpus reesii 1704]